MHLKVASSNKSVLVFLHPITLDNRTEPDLFSIDKVPAGDLFYAIKMRTILSRPNSAAYKLITARQMQTPAACLRRALFLAPSLMSAGGPSRPCSTKSSKKISKLFSTKFTPRATDSLILSKMSSRLFWIAEF